MAAPITHVAITARVFDKFFKGRAKEDFFIGSLFPDIRYLGVIARDKTHYANITLNDLVGDDSFLAGVKFHSILDAAREKFMVENDVYALCPRSKYITQSLKILEDEILYKYVKDWQEYINYLKNILPEEINLGISNKDAQRWHNLLMQYFKKQPNEHEVTVFALGFGFSKEATREINENIADMKNNKKIISMIKSLYRNFDTLIK